MVKTIYNNNTIKLNAEAFNIFVSCINDLLKIQDRIILGIPGGSSVLGLFKLLKENYSLLPWENIHIFLIDERIVDLDNEFCNFKQANETFISELLLKNIINRKNIHPYNIKPGLQDYGVGKYCEELKSLGGTYDIVILGVGEDGHIAALFPNYHSLLNESEDFVIMHDSPKIPPKRFTASKKLLIKAKTAITFFLGDNKRNAYKNYLNKNLEIKNCPVKLINQIKKSYIITNIKTNANANFRA